MIIDDTTYNELLEYLVRRPWIEVNKLLGKLAAANRPRIETPDVLKENPDGN